MSEHKVNPCGICGTPTCYTDDRCTTCWRVEDGLAKYLQSPRGQEFVREHLPKLDDWVGNKPDAWDYEAVLHNNNVTVDWGDTVMDWGDTVEDADNHTSHVILDLCGWVLSWKHGVVHIGQTTQIIARKAAALFVSLWLRGVSASFADKLMDGFIVFLERQENMSLTFLAEIDTRFGLIPHFRLTREAAPVMSSTIFASAEYQIIKALDVRPDEEVIVTFTKRKRHA